ncbi:MAG: site-specific integrase [Bacteroidetes bacterium]|nr:site-specific integrase [Bacteroidota bacterium]
MRKYSKKTISAYTSLFRQFMVYYKRKHLDEITDEEIRDYLLYLNTKRQVSDSFLNQAINAIKFYYEKVLGRPNKEYYLQRPRTSHKLPEVMRWKRLLRYSVLLGI